MMYLRSVSHLGFDKFERCSHNQKDSDKAVSELSKSDPSGLDSDNSDVNLSESN